MNLNLYFEQAIEKNASDLHIVAGAAPTIRINGELETIEESTIDNQELTMPLRDLVGQEIFDDFLSKKEADFSLNFLNNRFRVNLHFQRGLMGLTARLIKENIPGPDELNFSETLKSFSNLRDGLILVAGPTGCGKSTTLAAMIESINRERRSHVVTIENPIEYVFKNNKSLIEQREIGTDTYTFANALKYVLRQDPNVIMIGEMRDPETIAAALTAAETGHLVLSTLHTNTATETISRIIDSFPTNSQQQVLLQLSTSLRAIIAQQLLPRAGGGLIAAREILINNQAVANLIRRNQPTQIQTVIETSQKEGMIDFNKAIDQLFEQGLININTAKTRKRNVENKATYY